MKPRTKHILVWTPRVLAFAFALFLSLFALDVFGVGYGFWETPVALFGGFGIWYVASNWTIAAVFTNLLGVRWLQPAPSSFGDWRDPHERGLCQYPSRLTL